MFWCLGHVFDMADALSAWNNNDNSHYELVVSGLIFIIQFALGAFYAMITTGYYSLASLALVEKEVAMSVVESSVGIGHIVGPIVGSVLYDEQGYQFVYISGVAFSMLIAAFVSWRYLVPIFEGQPTDVAVGHTEVDGERCKSVDSSKNDETASDASDDDLNSECSKSVDSAKREIVTGYQSMNIQMIQDDKPAKRLSALSLLEFPVILLAACSICWAMVTWAFLEPLLAKQLDNVFNVGNKGIGIIFSLTSIVYVPATLLVQYIPSTIGRLKTIFISLLLTPIVVLLVGSNSLPFVVLGVGLLGLIPAPVWVMLLPWMQDETLMLFPDPDTKLKANDLIASIYNSFMTLGKVVGYTIGSLSNGFARTTQTVALLIFVHSILFYFGTRERKTSHRSQATQGILC